MLAVFGKLCKYLEKRGLFLLAEYSENAVGTRDSLLGKMAALLDSRIGDADKSFSFIYGAHAPTYKALLFKCAECLGKRLRTDTDTVGKKLLTDRAVFLFTYEHGKYMSVTAMSCVALALSVSATERGDTENKTHKLFVFYHKIYLQIFLFALDISKKICYHN